MKERLVTLLGGLLALFIVYVLFGPKAEVPVSRPTSVDAGEFGFSALAEWLRGGGIPVHSLRMPYDELLLRSDIPERGNLVIVSLPSGELPLESESFAEFIARGNSVLVLHALSDWPGWASRYGDMASEWLLSDLGYEVEGRADSEGWEPLQGEIGEAEPAVSLTDQLLDPLVKLSLTPALEHPLLAGVKQVAATWYRTEGHYWRLTGSDHERAVLVLLREGEEEPAFWLARVGEGSLLLARHADLFSNGHILDADNAQLMANIVAWSLAEGGAVIFDDYHHGLSELYDPTAFYADSRLHRTLGFLGFLWLVWLIGSGNRLRSASRPVVGMGLVDEVRALGGLLARRVRREAVAQRLFSHFFNAVRGNRGANRNGQPAWELLADDPRIEPVAIERLKALHRALERGEAVDLMELQEWLYRTRKMQQ